MIISSIYLIIDYVKWQCYKLKDYIHIGSIKEYQELKYWESYFDYENR